MPQASAEPVSGKTRYTITIRESWCKGCGICVEFCKPGVLAMEGLYAVVVDPVACTGCLQCELLCPDFAIEVEG
jgi:2-oxoglutarate ferredoxin oxidoreductase subunit delta